MLGYCQIILASHGISGKLAGGYLGSYLDFENGVIFIGPEEMPILVWGRRKHPQLKWDRPKTYKF